jgi:hypothetical protein
VKSFSQVEEKWSLQTTFLRKGFLTHSKNAPGGD